MQLFYELSNTFAVETAGSFTTFYKLESKIWPKMINFNYINVSKLVVCSLHSGFLTLISSRDHLHLTVTRCLTCVPADIFQFLSSLFEQTESLERREI